jgi:hypothetical protein
MCSATIGFSCECSCERCISQLPGKPGPNPIIWPTVLFSWAPSNITLRCFIVCWSTLPRTSRVDSGWLRGCALYLEGHHQQFSVWRPTPFPTYNIHNALNHPLSEQFLGFRLMVGKTSGSSSSSLLSPSSPASEASAVASVPFCSFWKILGSSKVFQNCSLMYRM